jgi:integrase
LVAQDAAMFEPELTFELACARWWNEVGQFRKDHDRCRKNLKWLLKQFGTTIMLHDITPSRIAHMVAARRGEASQRNKKDRQVRISNSTVNRTAVQPLRTIIVTARERWNVRVARIKWSQFMLKEPQERVREATVEEEAAINDRLDRGYGDAVDFAFKTGARKMEVVGLAWSKINWFARDGKGEFTLDGKGDKSRTLPMTPYVRELLRRQLGRHKVNVFTFASAYTRTGKNGIQYVKGEHYPLTMEGFASAVKRAVAAAGVENFRLHDMRHTAATRMARNTNLKVVQRTLGHSRYETTLRYAHVQQEDIAGALEAAERGAKSYTESYTEAADKAASD